MKFERKEITDIVFVQFIGRPCLKDNIKRMGTNDIMQCAGRLQNTDKFVFKNIDRNAYCEYTKQEIFEKLYIEEPTLEIGDWLAVWEPSIASFLYKQIKTNEDCNDYNARCDWRQITQAEWEKLNSPTYLPLCQEEATIVLQKRIEETIRKAVQEAIEEWKKKNEAKNTAASTNNWCENEL